MMLLLCALVAGSSCVWGQVASVAPADGGSYVIAAYVNSKYYALPNGTVNGGTIKGTEITLNAINKVSTSDATGKTWTLEEGTGNNAGKFYIKYTSSNKEYFLYKNGTGSSNHNFAVNMTSKNYWSFTTNGTGYTVAAVDRGTNHVNIKCANGTFSCDNTATSIILLEVGDAPSGTTAAPTISGSTPFYGSTTVTITNAASADGADRYYTLNGDDPTTTTSATCFAYSAPFSIDATATVKAIAKKASDTNASPVVSKTFTLVTPITVASALTAIDALSDNGTIEEQSVRGIITKINSISSNKISYVISDDVAGSNELTIYKGKGLYNADFAAITDLKLGDDVVIYGTLKKYKSGNTITPEFIEGNYLLYKESKAAPTFTLSTTAETLSMGNTETVDVTLTTNTDGAITCESDDEDVATVTLKSAGVYTITGHVAGSATITIKSAMTDNYQPASATVDITVTDTREEAGISFAEDAEEITWGDAYTGQALTNTNSLPVTWSSTDETVATVNASGVVSVLKAGSTDIKATFAGDATYKSAVASYTLTINKAAAGLSYAQTEFEIMLGDDSFVAPTLNNPNSLTVTYSSNNETLAVVDENTGELVYDENIAGTATITASFAGNDNYKAGNAKYTLNIVDPTAKGSKYNPYTVAELEGQETATTFGNNIYVIGYIVGSIKDNKCYKTTTDNLVNTNLLLADTPDVSFTEGVSVASNSDGLIPVELPNSPASIRSNWGVASNNVMGYKVLLKGNAQQYFSTKGIKGTSEISAVTIPYTMNQYGWSTLVSDKALNFEGSGVKAYVVTGHNGNALEKTEVTTVAANTPLLLNAAAGNHEIPVAASGTAYTDNKLVAGTGAAVAKEDGKTKYVLSLDDNGNIAFLKINNDPATVPADKAYLEFNEVVAAPSFDFGDATAIDDVRSKTEDVRGDYYNLNGQRVANPTKGLYIVNGKKVIVK